MPQQVYIRLVCTFCMLARTWMILTLNVETANSMLCRKLQEILGEGLYNKVGFTTPALLVPYVYGTMKSKCWHAGVKVCKKKRAFLCSENSLLLCMACQTSLEICASCFGNHCQTFWCHKPCMVTCGCFTTAPTRYAKVEELGVLQMWKQFFRHRRACCRCRAML